MLYRLLLLNRRVPTVEGRQVTALGTLAVFCLKNAKGAKGAKQMRTGGQARCTKLIKIVNKCYES